jgi:hypothetical protein
MLDAGQLAAGRQGHRTATADYADAAARVQSGEYEVIDWYISKRAI